METASLDPDFTRLDPLFRRFGSASGIPWKWLKAIGMRESNLGRDPRVAAGQVSSDGLSWGLMQLRLATAQDREPNVTLSDLKNEETSVRIAAKQLAWIRGELAHRGVPPSDPRFNELTIKAYNQGARRSAEEYFGGPAYANAYWAAFQKNLSEIESKQPGG